MADDGDHGFVQPREAGWYPDPWSATGTGERYFDGKRWGTTERPLGRQSNVVSLKEHEAAKKTGRMARLRGPIVVALLVVVAFVVLPKLQGGKSNSQASSVHPPASQEESTRPLGTPAPLPAATGPYEFEQTQPGDSTTPVAWDPCRPIHYVVNPAGAPGDGSALLRSAITRIQLATGLHFLFDGTTSEPPTKNRDPYLPKLYNKDRWAPVLIAWSTETQTPDLAGYIAGITQPVAAGADSAHLAYVSGEIVFDETDMATNRIRDRGVAKAIMLHELGHLVGLDHTSDRKQIMFSESSFNVKDYGAGDLHGLAILGTQPCYPKI